MIRKTAPGAALGVLIAAAPFSQVWADPPAQELPDIVITADRVPESIEKTGTSITVVPASEIEKWADKGVADVLRDVAGVDVVEAGGAGQATSVSLRGAGSERTLVLVDGVPVGDPSATDGSLNFGNLLPVDIERIEVLRGPQSALYGSDAMGGVINIITRKGKKKYRTLGDGRGRQLRHARDARTMSGGDDRWTYSLGYDLMHTEGFPRFGYRIDRPITIDYGAFAAAAVAVQRPDQPRRSLRPLLLQAVGRRHDRLGPRPARQREPIRQSLRGDPQRRVQHLQSSVDLHRQRLRQGDHRSLERASGNISSPCSAISPTPTYKETELLLQCGVRRLQLSKRYRGGRYGAEYQGDLNFGPWGATDLRRADADGNRKQLGRTRTRTTALSRRLLSSRRPSPASANIATRRSIISTCRSAAGSIPSLDGPTFETWRATAAYRFDTGTKIRASAGTGAKVPTLYERFSPYGTPDLLPETNFAYDVGMDQNIFDDRATLSATYFCVGLSESDQLRRRARAASAVAARHRRRLLLQCRARADTGRRILR